jgi:pimeloyl-ACP methyl ester carboxylesterase
MKASQNQLRPPVVIIHGMWSTPDSLKDIKQSFEEEGYVTYTPRLPLHLPRNKLDAKQRTKLGSLSVQDYLKSLEAFMEKLDQPPILVGHSMGGLLAQLIAAKFPCEKLILISSAPPAGINGWHWSVMRTFGHNLFKFPLWRTTTNLLLKNIRYGIANSQSAAVHREISQNTTFESGLASWQISMWFLFRRPPTKVDYDKIRCPVLIIGGSEDKITPLKSQLKIARNYANRATVKVIPGACHWTIGGSHFPIIKQTLFTWLTQKNDNQTSCNDNLKARAA